MQEKEKATTLLQTIQQSFFKTAATKETAEGDLR
jgi:hypothetical protein